MSNLPELSVTYRIVGRLFTARELLRPSNMLKGRRSTVSLLLAGTFFVVFGIILLLLLSWISLGRDYIASRLIPCLAVIVYLVGAGIFLRKGFISATSWMLIGLYAFLALVILLMWSINAPVGILTLGFVIILVSVLIGARHIVPTTVTLIVLLTMLQIATEMGLIVPDRANLRDNSTFGDVASYSIIFSIFAVVTWLSGRRMELALEKAHHAEVALEQEKALLADRLDEQTRKLRAAQLKEIEQVYHFAEIGQQSTAVLHELANHLTALTLDINDIEQQYHHSRAVSRARENIDTIDDMIRQVRRQLHQNHETREFEGTAAVKEAVAKIEQKARKASTTVTFKQAGKEAFYINGDVVRLCQIISILMTNAIEAYVNTDAPPKKRRIIVSTTVNSCYITIRICDFGIGIPESKRQTLFSPQLSTKRHGLGIGLYIAHSMTCGHFGGELSLDPRADRTEFIVKIPRTRDII